MGFDNFTSVGPGCSPRPEETVANGLEVTLPYCDEEHNCSNWQKGLFTSGVERLKSSLNSKSFTDLYTVQKTLGRGVDGQHDVSLDSRNNKSRRWWRSLMTCKYDVSVKVGKVSPNTNLKKVQNSSKRCKGYGALHLGQEIQAHKGIIRAMKFSPSGSYLTSGGEDCVVRIWKVGDASFKCLNADGENFGYADDVEGGTLKFSRKVPDSSADAVIVEKDFKIVQVLLQEFHGHSSDILDLWLSKSNGIVVGSIEGSCEIYSYSGGNLELDRKLCA
ncbi:hypothetical protein J5N97_022470 [Dioscorea zingiberensis]|uniref:Uncharacterized protein n=1 Tax=Dioscorea zingiberensis TaxID=325984 RepID=A0A9D5CB95_9LILI|nr:hypothetical protein J5N97_022470 [Dioscorea zingiberensis]